eukprot:g8914.t1
MMSQEGLKTRMEIMRSHLKSGMCAGIIQKHVPDFHASKFPGVANKVFKEFFEAHRKGDLSALAGLTTEELYGTLKGEVKRTKSKGQRRAAFRLLDFKEPTRVLQMRVKRNKNISPKEGWGQVTCRLCSERELVLVDASGKEVQSAKGDGAAVNTKAQNVTIGIFEVFFGDPSGRWRLALVQEMSEKGVGKGMGAETTPQAPAQQ